MGIRIEMEIAKKCNIAKELIPLKTFDKVTKKELPEWQRKHDLLEEIEEQIEVCEGLYRPLSIKEIELLCTFDNAIQVSNYCRPLKLA